MAVKFIRNKNDRRPRKKAADKRRRVKVQKQRALALGVPAEKAEQLNTREIRALLRHPKRTTARFAKSA